MFVYGKRGDERWFFHNSLVEKGRKIHKVVVVTTNIDLLREIMLVVDGRYANIYGKKLKNGRFTVNQLAALVFITE